MNEHDYAIAVHAKDGFYPWGGYEWIEASRKAGWHPVSSWGQEGWDLGEWPLVIVSVRNGDERKPEPFELCVYVEGDLDITSWRTQVERSESIDTVAHYYWKDEPWYKAGERRFSGPCPL